MTNMWNAVAAFFKDLVVSAVGAVLSLFASMVEAIPVPDFIANFNMSQILGSAGSDLGYFMGVLQISKGMAALGAGYAFRLLRKFLTLFQW